MKIQVELELAPFTVPNYVSVKGSTALKEEGFTADRTLHLTELSTETLERLCEEFTRGVFAKAKKTSKLWL